MKLSAAVGAPAWWDPAVGAPPRFATPRSPDRDTLGPEVASVMRMLGAEPMPWQRLVLDVAYELDEDGELVYRECGLVVPRQAGKTTKALGRQVHRALMMAERLGVPQNSIYTAQTRNHARTKFVDEHLPILDRSPFADLYRARLALGSEAVLWDTGSIHRVEAPSKDAGHGGSIDMADADEAFALEDDRLEQGLKPTMITRRSPQFWWISAGPEYVSRYQLEKMAAGRERVRAGLTSRACYFEWSAMSEEEAEALGLVAPDAADPETWWATHPALGFTIPESAVAADFETMKLAEFERAYLCRLPSLRSGRVIGGEAWAAVRDPRSTIVDPVAFAVSVDPDRSRSSLSAAGARGDGLLGVEVVQADAGTGWVAGQVARALGRAAGSLVGLDGGSAAAALLPALEQLGVVQRSKERPDGRLVVLGMRDAQRAAGAFFDAVIGTPATVDENGVGQEAAPAQLRHRGQVVLDAAVAGAVKRKLGDAWAWGRAEGVDITPLESSSLALWVHLELPRLGGHLILGETLEEGGPGGPSSEVPGGVSAGGRRARALVGPSGGRGVSVAGDRRGHVVELGHGGSPGPGTQR